ncbi:hypothetical protein GQ457_17G009390 [Hibiscus cannabinus]
MVGQTNYGVRFYASFSIVVNGERGKSFKPQQGLRQGDPLSPFLFIIVANVLSTLLKREMASQSLIGFRMGRRCLVISHLLFADDCLIFSQADGKNCQSIMKIIKLFSDATGQAVNFEKSAIFFSPNLDPQSQRSICEILKIKPMEKDCKYLGILAMWGRGKKEALSFIRERI